jgi:hypothetical protein
MPQSNSFFLYCSALFVQRLHLKDIVFMPSLRLRRHIILMYLLYASRRTVTTTAFSTLSNTLCKTRPAAPSCLTSLSVSLPSSPSTANQITSFSTMMDVDANDFPKEMSEAERYLFDLNGFIIVRNVLTPDEVAACHIAIDKHVDEAVDRDDPSLRNAVEGSPMYGTGPPRLDLGGIFEWGKVDSNVFKSILAHPRLVPLFHGLLGKGYRLDHIPFVLINNKGGEGFQLHGGTVDCTSGEYNHHLAYTCHNGSIQSALLGCNVMLVDHNPGDGGFCVVPGSHKSNFKMPPGMVDGLTHSEYIVQPATKAGDVVLFSEGTGKHCILFVLVTFLAVAKMLL